MASPSSLSFCGRVENKSLVTVAGPAANECFVNGLSFIPSALFMLAAAPVIISWSRSFDGKMHAKSWVHFPNHNLRWIICLMLAVVNLAEIGEGVISDFLYYDTSLHLFLPPVITLCGTIVSVVYYHAVEDWNSPRFLLLLALYWGFSLGVEMVKLVNLHKQNLSFFYVRWSLTWVSFGFYIILSGLEINVWRKLKYILFKRGVSLRPAEELADTGYVHSYVSLLSKATYFWVQRLIRHGFKHPLDMDDLGKLPQSERSVQNYKKLMCAFQEETRRAARMKKQPSLWRCYWKAFWPMMLLAGLLKLSGDLLHFVGPVCLAYIIRYVEESSSATYANATAVDVKEKQFVNFRDYFSNGYILSVMIFLAMLLQNTFLQTQNYLVMREGIRLRGALQMLIYDKALKLSTWTLSNGQMTQGQIVNHISVDTSNMLFYFYIIHYVWTLPVKLPVYCCVLSLLVPTLIISCCMYKQVTVTVILLYYQLGVSALVSGAVVLILCPVQYQLGRLLAKIQKKTLECSDKRLQQCSELFQCIKLVKLYAWEACFQKKVENTRRLQLSYLLKGACIKTLSLFITEGTPIMATLVAFSLYPYLQNEPLTAARAFSSLALFDILGVPLLIFPLMVTLLVNAKVSTERLLPYLLTPEVSSEREEGDLEPKDVKVEFHLGNGGSANVSICGDDSLMETVSERVRNLHRLMPESRRTSSGPALSVLDEEEERHESFSDHSLQRDESPIPPGLKKDETIQSEDSQPLVEDKQSEDEQREKKDADKEIEKTDSAQDVRDTNKKDKHQSDKSDRKLRLRNLNKKQRQKPEFYVPNEQPEDKKHPHHRSDHILLRSQSADADCRLAIGKRMKPRKSSLPAVANPAQKGSSSTLSRPDDGTEPGRLLGNVVEVSNATFTWDPTSNEPVLKDLSLQAEAGKLTVIVGPVAAGKSSLLAAMLGEMTKISGSVIWRQGVNVAYAGPRPWLVNATLRDNILFGIPFEKRRYKRVLHACALMPDISILPAGDLTEIGEKGINLSHGQRQRLCVARAMYSKADVVILDDPFSTLDLHVEAHIFEDGIMRFLIKRQKAVILVTHHLQYLSFAHQIYRIEDGCVSHEGTLQQIKELDPFLFSVWQDAVRKFRSDAKSEPEDHKTEDERKRLRHMILSKDFNKQVSQTYSLSSADEERSGYDTPKGMLLSQQMSHASLFEDVGMLEEALYLSISRGGSRAGSMERLPTEDSKDKENDDDDDDEEKSDEKGKLISEEERARGTVSLHVICVYLKSSSWLLALLVILIHLGRNFVLITTDFWLSWWVAANMTNYNDTSSSGRTSDVVYYVKCYVALSFVALFLTLIVVLVTELTGLRAATVLHSKMLKNVIYAPLSFFDVTPLGRIISRFSGDVNAVDDKLPTSIEHFLRVTLLCLAALVVNSIATLFFIIPTLPILVVYFFIHKVFRASSRDLQRLDTMTKSPVLSLFSETLEGLPTIRAYRDEGRLHKMMMSAIDANTSAYLWLNTANRWLAVRLEYLAAVIVLCSTISATTAGLYGYISSALVGLAIAYALLMSTYLNWVVRSGAEAEIEMNAVERIVEYAEIPTEHTSGVSTTVPEDWPAHGEVVYENVSAKFGDSTDLAVKDISFHLKPGEKIGVCGRTGSGKTSITLPLFRLIDLCTGHIVVDGIDISRVPLNVLRSRIAIIPQDPVLFAGTVRFNLDPEGHKSDEELWEALEVARLKDIIKNWPETLDYVLSEGGDNFSTGQRQLFCLARAVLRKASVIVVDDVLSCADSDIDEPIEDVVLSTFPNKSILLIAHRMSTLMSCDSVLVLERGLLVEQGKPATLLLNDDGVFRAMVNCKNPHDFQ